MDTDIRYRPISCCPLPAPVSNKSTIIKKMPNNKKEALFFLIIDSIRPPLLHRMQLIPFWTLLETISKKSFGSIGALRPDSESSTYCSMPAIRTYAQPAPWIEIRFLRSLPIKSARLMPPCKVVPIGRKDLRYHQRSFCHCPILYPFPQP